MPDDIDVQADNGLEEPHGMNPTEEVGPQDAEAGMADVEYKLVDDREDSLSGSDYTLRDEIGDAFPTQTINVGVDPADGLPTPMDTQSISTAMPFDKHHLVCLEDDSEYVEVFVAEQANADLYDPLPPSVFDGLFPGLHDHGADVQPSKLVVPCRERYDDNGNERERRSFKPEQVIKRWGSDFVQTPAGLVLVRPKRERCRFYMRQVSPNDEQPDPKLPGHKIIFRRCSALRSNGGALLSLRDEGVYACDHRSPPDPETVRIHLDEPDRKRANTPVEMVPLFGITQNDGDRG